MGMISPDDLLLVAKTMVLEGREPETRDDWVRILNFVAYNVDPTTAHAACSLFVIIYKLPITLEEADAIASYQVLGKAFNNAMSQLFPEGIRQWQLGE